jgi:hypothetical protein
MATVELGNIAPHSCVTVDGVHSHASLPANPGPTFTRVSIPDEYELSDTLDIRDVALHLARNPDVTSMAGIQALLPIIHPGSGLWAHWSAVKPSWVWSDDPKLEAYLAEWFDCPAGHPADLEDTHFTYHGPPGVGPGSVTERAEA